MITNKDRLTKKPRRAKRKHYKLEPILNENVSEDVFVEIMTGQKTPNGLADFREEMWIYLRDND